MKADYCKNLLSFIIFLLTFFLLPGITSALDGQVYFGLFDSDNYRAFLTAAKLNIWPASSLVMSGNF
jgi:hypothetical protein